MNRQHTALAFGLFLLAPGCFAKDAWFVLNREIGCERLIEVHDYLTYTQGTWTPQAMFAAVKRKHADATMVPFLDMVQKEQKASGKQPTEDEREYFGKFTRSNAFFIESDAGRVEIPLFERGLCEKLGILPREPEQWLADFAQWRGKWPGGETIPAASVFDTSAQGWYETRSEGWHHANFIAERELKDQSLVAARNMAMAYASDYKPEPGKQPYLVRGVIAGDEPHRTVVLKDGTLFVIVRGPRAATLRFAPVVVNLPTAPKAVVVLFEEE